MYSGLHIGSQVSVDLAFHGHRMGLEGEVPVQDGAPRGPYGEGMVQVW